MSHPYAALMLADLILAERDADLRNRQAAHAFLESRRATHPSFVDRIRHFAGARPASSPALADCVACA
jgi:hypothetical protein